MGTDRGQLAHRFTCVAVDLPGHGRSEGPQRGIDDVALAISQLLGELEVEPPVVIGHSLGGAVAGSYAAHHRARGLVMVDQATYVLPFAAMLHQFEPALRGENFRAAFEPVRQTIGVELLPEPQRTSILASQRINQDVVLGYWDEVLATTPDELQARIDRDTKAIAVPVLAVFGHAIDAATREHLLTHLPSPEIEEWVGLGHMVHLMDPERFARRLTEFAERCFSTSP
jgi:pimeloyl-ACP methyl ester carboxylesterase